MAVETNATTLKDSRWPHAARKQDLWNQPVKKSFTRVSIFSDLDIMEFDTNNKCGFVYHDAQIPSDSSVQPLTLSPITIILEAYSGRICVLFLHLVQLAINTFCLLNTNNLWDPNRGIAASITSPRRWGGWKVATLAPGSRRRGARKLGRRSCASYSRCCRKIASS